MISGINFRRLFLLAVLLPAAIFLVDQWTLGRYDFGQPSLLVTLVLYALFVGQVAFMGWIVGRWLPHPVLCWAAYLWAIALVDVSCFRAAVDDSNPWRGSLIDPQKTDGASPPVKL
jgi:hypothetical protein